MDSMSKRSFDNTILDAARLSNKEPYNVKVIYVKGFKLMIHWDEKRNWFECCMHHSPRSSSYYYYGLTEEELLNEIKQGMKTWEKD